MGCRRPSRRQAVVALVCAAVLAALYQGVFNRACRWGSCGEDVLTSSLVKAYADSPGWRRFVVDSPALHTPGPVVPSAGEKVVPYDCAEHWIAASRVHPSCRALAEFKVDALWTWVDGADPVLSTVREYAFLHPDDSHRWDRNDDWPDLRRVRPSRPLRPGGLAKHFRQHDELMYSMRAAVASLGSSRIRKVQILTADVRSGPDSRLGQVPPWLNLSAEGVVVRHHSEAFKAPAGWLSRLLKVDAGEQEARQWRDRVVPSFTSLGIESQIPHLDNLGDLVWYFNDDVFALKNMTRGDVATPLMGPVFRIQRDLFVKPLDWGAEKSTRDGEWPSLSYSNFVLSRRFGERPRPYVAHFARTLPVATMRELVDLWPDEFAQSGATRFRGRGPELTLTFMTTYYHIERHRETLLYSFIVLACETVDGRHTSAGRDRLLAAISSPPAPPVSPLVELGADVFEAPAQTNYTWTSNMGYPLGNVTSDSCPIDSSVVDVFKRFAFELPGCGDALIASLSGHGLGAFLPDFDGDSDAAFRGPDWRTVDFSPSSRGRRWAVRTIQRWSYVIGDSPAVFVPLYGPGDASRRLKPLGEPGHPAVYAALNDDLRTQRAVQLAEPVMRSFFETRFGGLRGWWELQ